MLEGLHPIVVHFPIALLTVGLGLELARARRPAGDWVIDALIAVGAAGAIAAAFTGDSALASMSLPEALRAAAEDHEQAGSLAAWTSGAALLCRIISRLSTVPRRGVVSSPVAQARGRWLSVILLGLATILTLRAAYLGGHLVHDLGVTRATMPARVPTAPASPSTYEAEP